MIFGPSGGIALRAGMTRSLKSWHGMSSTSRTVCEHSSSQMQVKALSRKEESECEPDPETPPSSLFEAKCKTVVWSDESEFEK